MLQLFYAESNFDYNKDVQLVNSLIQKQKSKVAFRLVRTMEKKGIFTNNDLVRIKKFSPHIWCEIPFENVIRPWAFS